MPNPVSRTSPVGAVDENIGRLDVLVDKAALMKLAERRGHTDGQTQEASDLHGCVKLFVERLANRILKHQHGLAGYAHEVERPQCPRAVKLILQFKFVSEAIEG